MITIDDGFIFTVDDVVQSIGTTELLMAVVEAPVEDLKPEYFVYPFLREEIMTD